MVWWWKYKVQLSRLIDYFTIEAHRFTSSTLSKVNCLYLIANLFEILKIMGHYISEIDGVVSPSRELDSTVGEKDKHWLELLVFS